MGDDLFPNRGPQRQLAAQTVQISTAVAQPIIAGTWDPFIRWNVSPRDTFTVVVIHSVRCRFIDFIH